MLLILLEPTTQILILLEPTTQILILLEPTTQNNLAVNYVCLILISHALKLNWNMKYEFNIYFRFQTKTTGARLNATMCPHHPDLVVFVNNGDLWLVNLETRQVHYLVDWLDWLIGWLVNWLIDWVFGWLIDKLNNRTIDRIIGRIIGRKKFNLFK